MPAIQSPFFGINYGWAFGESLWNSGMDLNMKVMSFLHAGAVDSVTATLPGSPSNGDSVIYTVDNQLYVRIGGAWVFITPKKGMEVNENTTGKKWQFDGSGWVETLSEIKLSNSTDPTKGAGLVGWTRTALSSSVNNAHGMLDAQAVNIWEFAQLVTDKPNPNDPSTWIWSPAIQGAIDSLSSTGGGVVELNEGTFLVNAPIIMKSGVTLQGRGDASVIKANFASPTNRIISSPDNVLQTNVCLRDFKVDRTGTNSQHGVILGGIDGLLIDNVTVKGFVSGVTSGAMGISPFDNFAQIQSKNVIVKNCKIDTSNNFGIAFGNVINGQIINNTFINCWREAVGLEAWGDGTISGPNPLGTLGVVENCIASGNTIFANTDAANHTGGTNGPAILVGGATSLGRVTGCVISGNTIIISNPSALTDYHGIGIVGSATQVTSACVISDNTIMSAPGRGINTGALGQITNNLSIQGNVILNSNSSSSTNPAIFIRNTTDSQVSDNKVIGTLHTYGIEESTGSDRNIFKDNDMSSGTLGAFLQTGVTSVFRGSRGLHSEGGRIIQEQFTVLDDGTAISKPRAISPNNNRTICFITSSLGGNYAILLFNGTSAPIVISKSVDVVTGATNPDTDDALNVYPQDSQRIAIKNRLGSTRDIYVMTVGTI